jgi:thiol:disulfide interchange protein
MTKKYALAILVIPFLILSAFKPAQTPAPKAELKWYGWNEGYAKAVKEGKIVLVDAYTDWCGWCKKMDRDTYSNPRNY